MQENRATELLQDGVKAARDAYELKIREELSNWKLLQVKKPSAFDRYSKKLQVKINSYIPDKVHAAITAAIKNMVRGVLFGAEYLNQTPVTDSSLLMREANVRQRIDFYKKTGATEGAVTGAGGFLLSLADFPILMGLKMKLLYEIAALYGKDVKDYKERIFTLLVFQLAFSGPDTRLATFKKLEDWEAYSKTLPEDIHQFDWLTFQQEYRDYIDIAKLAQLIPFIGAAVGAIANYKLLNRLGETAMQAYRMRYFSSAISR